MLTQEQIDQAQLFKPWAYETRREYWESIAAILQPAPKVSESAIPLLRQDEVLRLIEGMKDKVGPNFIDPNGKSVAKGYIVNNTLDRVIWAIKEL
jgi:hypothetical protein